MRPLWTIPFSLCPFLILSTPGPGQTVDRGLRGEYPILASEGKVYLGTPRGLRVYDVSEDDWAFVLLPGGEKGNFINLLGVHQGILWAGTRGGVANADVRLGDWLLHDREAGLKDNLIRSLAFEEDYAWVGTDSGASRLDLLSQQWSSYGQALGLGGRVNDIAVDGKTVWFATDSGVVEYESEFEAWRPHTEVPDPVSREVESILLTGDYVWFFGRNGAGRFNKPLRAWEGYAREDGLKGYPPNDLALEGDSVWAVSPEGVSVYDPESGRWSDFPEERYLPSKDVRSIVVSNEEIWFGTAQGIARYERRTGNWRTYSKAQGISSPLVMSIALYGGLLFAPGEQAVDYLKLGEERWYSLDISVAEPEKPGFLTVSEAEGARIQLSPQLGLALKGRTTCEVAAGEGGFSDPETRNDLKLMATLPQERTGYAFYNDTDPQGVQYGLKYRGREEDMLREAALGDLRCDLGRAELVRALGLYGASAEVGIGGEADTAGERQVRLTGSAGERTTAFQTDLFVGGNREQAIETEDIDYERRKYYLLDTTSTLVPLLPGSEKVWVDDGLAETNTPNTLEDMTIGGVLGDFDPFIPGEDYILDYHQGILEFTTPRPATDVVAVEYQFSGRGSGHWEGVIQGGGAEGFELENRYYLKGREVIPLTLSIRLLDLNSTDQPLSDFGFDRDLDGLVDPELVDYQKGVLRSHDLHPFPDEVYSPSSPVHLYTIQAQYESRASIFNLSQAKLVRESEVVLLDGSPLERGDDYILDYTSGSLLILREELIGERSEIEVTYEYWCEPGRGLGSVGAEMDLGRSLNLGARAVQFEDTTSDTLLSNVQLLDASSELRFNLAGLHARFPMELAQSRGPDGPGQAYHCEALASSERLRLRGAYESWDEDFRSVAVNRSKLGLLTKRYLLNTEYRLKSYLTASAAWKSQVSAADDTAAGGKEGNLQGRVLLNKKGFPVLGLSGGLSSTDTPLSTSHRKGLSGDFEYELPRGAIRRLPVRALRASSYLGRTWEETRTAEGFSGDLLYDAGLLRLSLCPAGQVEVGSSYRFQFSRAQGGQDTEPRFGLEELLLFSRLDRVPGLCFHLRAEGLMSEDFLPERTDARDLSLERRREWALQVYPGVWARRLSPLSFELDWNSHWKGYSKGLTRSLSLGRAIFEGPAPEEVANHSHLIQQGLRGELRPTASLTLSSGYRRLHDQQRDLGTTLDRFTRLYSSQLELRPRFRSLMTAQLNLEGEETVGVREALTIFPVFRWEERWRENLLSKLSLSYSREREEERNIETFSSAISPGVGLTIRDDRLWLLGGVELSQDLSVSSSRVRAWTGETHSMNYASQFTLEVRPVKVVKLRTRLGLTCETGSVEPADLSHTFSFRLSAQF